jgi:hypothetical protein
MVLLTVLLPVLPLLLLLFVLLLVVLLLSLLHLLVLLVLFVLLFLHRCDRQYLCLRSIPATVAPRVANWCNYCCGRMRLRAWSASDADTPA